MANHSKNFELESLVELELLRQIDLHRKSPAPGEVAAVGADLGSWLWLEIKMEMHKKCVTILSLKL